jgi:hypothetical protein
LPNRYDIKLDIHRLINLLNIPVEKDIINKLRIISQGLSIIQTPMIFSTIRIKASSLYPSIYDLFITQKQKELKSNNFLELYINNLSLDDIGGIDCLKEWLVNRAESFLDISLNNELS